MEIRSDLALELTPNYESVDLDEYIVKSEIVVNNELSRAIKKPIGEYSTFETKIVTKSLTPLYRRLSEAIAEGLKKYTKGAKRVLVIGLGNPSLTADALGKYALEGIVITRNIPYIKDQREISGFCPNVMGITGIESFDVISGIVAKIKPNLIIAIDSLASAAISRIASAFQICSSGITPGSGVSNHRQRLDKNSLGVEVISIGVPLVVYGDVIVREAIKNSKYKEEIAGSIENDIATLIVTPKEIDLLVRESAKIISEAINIALLD